MAILLDCLVDGRHFKFDVQQLKSSRLWFKLGQWEAISTKAINMEPEAAICLAAYHFFLDPWVAGQSRFLFQLELFDVLHLFLFLVLPESLALLLLLDT